MTIKQPYDNETSQAERRQVLKDTMRWRTLAAQNTIGGRWASEGKTRVTGAATIEYPPQPPNRPWHHDPVPPEANEAA